MRQRLAENIIQVSGRGGPAAQMREDWLGVSLPFVSIPTVHSDSCPGLHPQPAPKSLSAPPFPESTSGSDLIERTTPASSEASPAVELGLRLRTVRAASGPCGAAPERGAPHLRGPPTAPRSPASSSARRAAAPTSELTSPCMAPSLEGSWVTTLSTVLPTSGDPQP